MIELRPATAADAAAVLAIYRPFVETSSITFETVVPDLQEMSERIERALTDYAWLVATEDDVVLGYAYAGLLRLRAAYRAAVEVSVYVAEPARGRGIATSLYQSLFTTLSDRAFHTALAAITLPNAPSIALHEGLGFSPAGHFREVGHKFGAWHDVGWWQRML